MWEEWDLLGPKGLLVPEYWLTVLGLLDMGWEKVSQVCPI